MNYTPSQKVLEKYADVLINFALNSGKGIKKGEVVQLVVNESAKPLFVELRRAVYKAGGNVIAKYIPDDDETYNLSKDYFNLASKEQLQFFPEKYLRGLVDTVDHSVGIISETNKHALQGVDPKKIMLSSQSMKPYIDWRTKKENQGKFTWTLALYGTKHMAEEVNLSEKEYWDQIIKACYLDKTDPIATWKEVYVKLETYRKKLNDLHIDKVHVEGEDVDLWVKIGEKRAWMGGSGRNIPSFELFTSPDWRGTEGWIKFNQPLYRYGNLITGVELEFKNGLVVKAKAKKNEPVLKEMIKAPNANKIGEFSLTDGRYSRITKFMGETLFDENVGGKEGNTHLALGKSYHDCYEGDPGKVTEKEWERLGYNDSVVHTDIVSTTRRKVTAYLPDGSEKVIYENGKFTL